jgi:RNA polymerase sigma-70 factor (ECF subfamily)
LRSVLGDEASADEACAELSLALWHGVGAFKGESSFRTWAYRIAWRTAQHQRNTPSKRRVRRLETFELDALAADVRSRTAPFLRTEAHELVQKARSLLSPDEQALLILRVDRGLSWSDVASVLAEEGETISQPVLWKRFERVKEKLRQIVRASAEPKE